jgi:hypothetical protein
MVRKVLDTLVTVRTPPAAVVTIGVVDLAENTITTRPTTPRLHFFARDLSERLTLVNVRTLRVVVISGLIAVILCDVDGIRRGALVAGYPVVDRGA